VEARGRTRTRSTIFQEHLIKIKYKYSRLVQQTIWLAHW